MTVDRYTILTPEAIAKAMCADGMKCAREFRRTVALTHSRPLVRSFAQYQDGFDPAIRTLLSITHCAERVFAIDAGALPGAISIITPAEICKWLDVNRSHFATIAILLNCSRGTLYHYVYHGSDRSSYSITRGVSDYIDGLPGCGC